MFVDDGVYLDNLKTEHAAVVGNDLHRQVSLAVGCAAAHRSAHARSVFRINPVHIERDVIARGAASGEAQGFFHYRAHAALVNIAHSEDTDAGAAHILFLHRVDVTHANQHAVFRLDLRRKVVDFAQF